LFDPASRGDGNILRQLAAGSTGRNTDSPFSKCLGDVQEWTILNKAVFLSSVTPDSHEEKEMALIERDRKTYP
jgi:hypothetical protein